jgi:hypothetical protein
MDKRRGSFVEKVIVAKIEQSGLILTAFGGIASQNPLLLGQVSTRLELEDGLSLLEKEIGAFDRKHLKLYIVSSIELKLSLRLSNMINSTDLINVKMTEVIKRLSTLFLQKVGDVLIFNVDSHIADLYYIKKGLIQPQGASFPVHIAKDDGIKTSPETVEEIALKKTLIAQTLQSAVLNLFRDDSSQMVSKSKKDLSNLRWAIGTGKVLADMPGGMELIREALTHCTDKVSFPQEGFPILIDQDNTLISLGALSDSYPDGAWQMILESLGVDS